MRSKLGILVPITVSLSLTGAARAETTYYLRIQGVAGNATDSVNRARADFPVKYAAQSSLHNKIGDEEKKKEEEAHRLEKELEDAARNGSFFSQIANFVSGSDGGVGDRALRGAVTPSAGRHVTFRLAPGPTLSRLHAAAQSGERFPQALVDVCSSGSPCQRYVLRGVTVAKFSPGDAQKVGLVCASIDGPSPAPGGTGGGAGDPQQQLLREKEKIRAEQEKLEQLKAATPTPTPRPLSRSSSTLPTR